ncbi:protein LURP-one-related 15-like [Impatiens glandulifera]|uniref:protein LURP-one-related 15-like n=1 Tax=Impatiens glandulifera TaxID=253017 RepID=UPI001FB18C31|nr:protein LURP-one-related 15-like [Impatiens glandulifera]
MTQQIPVIGPEYCMNYPVELKIVRKAIALTTGNFKVTDVNDNDLFKVEVKWSIHDRRILRDSAGNPVITLRQKIMTMHARWQIFRGDSTNKKDLIFTAKTSSWLQFKTKLNVFLAYNKKEKVSDFRLEGSYSKGSCKIYVGHGKSKSILAKMRKKETVMNGLTGKDDFRVTVNPNVDYAFVVALIVVLDNIDTYNEVKQEPPN